MTRPTEPLVDRLVDELRAQLTEAQELLTKSQAELHGARPVLAAAKTWRNAQVMEPTKWDLIIAVDQFNAADFMASLHAGERPTIRPTPHIEPAATITDEAVAAFTAAESHAWRTEPLIRTQGELAAVNRAAQLAGLTAAAPHIAAQALRDAVARHSKLWTGGDDPDLADLMIKWADKLAPPPGPGSVSGAHRDGEPTNPATCARCGRSSHGFACGGAE